MNTGDTGFIMICAALVFFMTPGLAFFYGGLVRRKNVVNTIMACTAIMGLSVVMWVLFGYSLSFGTNHGGVIGDLKWFALNGIKMDEAGPYADNIPHLVYVAFQMMFAMITPALITGSLVGRVKFKALFFFIMLWSIIVYYPMAHMVWGQGGFLGEIGSVDFAGGNVVHISSGVSALVFSIILGRRKGYENTAYRVHNIPFVALGAFILVWMVRFQCRKCPRCKWPCSTCIYDNSDCQCQRNALMDDNRCYKGRKAYSGRCINRSCSWSCGYNTWCRICTDLVIIHHRCTCQPDLLLYNLIPEG